MPFLLLPEDLFWFFMCEKIIITLFIETLTVNLSLKPHLLVFDPGCPPLIAKGPKRAREGFYSTF